jgi:two-component system nitrate/nitrite response regulator NarL
VRCALETNPHLVLLDMQLPGCDGGKACLQLRLNGFKGRIVLIGQSFDNNVAYAVDQYEADGFIAKPIWRSALLNQLEELGFLIAA